MKLEELQSKSIGLVLSGGGVRGMAHIGLIRALNEYGISANIVSGSSVGALIGALYAYGHSVENMLTFFKETPLFKYNFLTLAKSGFIDTDRYFKIFKGYFPEDSFEDLKTELHVVATNLQRGEQRFFQKGELIRPLLASAALPPLFSPLELDGELYADGGIMNNFPVEPIVKKANFIIGSNVSIVGNLKKKELKNSLQLTSRVTALMIYAINQKKLAMCDLLLAPEALENIGVIDTSGMERAYKIGYQSGIKMLEDAFSEV